MHALPIILFVAFVAIVGVGAWFAWKAEQTRIKALGELATRLGLRFDPRKNSHHDERFAQFEIFRRGHSRIAKNTLSGTAELFGSDCGVRLGDFRYQETSGSGKNRRTTTYDFSYLIVQLPWRTPPLLIRPEGVFDKIAAAFGFDDIDFESVEFSRAFLVKSDDKRFAYDVLHPRMMEFLLAQKPPMIDVEDGALCLADGSRRWSPEQFEERMDFVRQFAALWPRHLLADLDS